MSKMLTVIKRIVKEDINNNVTQLDAIYEAIINSIQANATHIKCRLLGEQQELANVDEGDNKFLKKVIAITIEDNGDGFNKENYESFGSYRSDHKVDLGCKGVGRFIFLKLFEDVKYSSFLKDEQQKIEFPLKFDFDTEDLSKTKEVVQGNKTILQLSSPTNEHFSLRYKNAERRLELDLSNIKEKLLHHLIPTLYLYKRQYKRAITIQIEDILGSSSVEITVDDIPEFKTVEFDISVDNAKIPFKLHHFIKNKSGKVHGFHCANNRAVCTFESKKFTSQGFQGILLLESTFLDESIDNFRNDFEIYPIQKDLYHPISWETINNKLKLVVSKIVHSEIPEVDKINKEKLREIQDERPYLVQYIEKEDINIAGFIGKSEIIRRAKKRFDEAKDNLLKNSNKSDYSKEELDEAITLTQNELVSYIQDRVAVIERLKTMVQDHEKIESIIHNLFMEQSTTDEEPDYFGTNRNNLWLLDDRFTSYSYAASDKRIMEILEQEGSDDDLSKPDLSLFFSQDPENKDGLKSVIVELKSFDDSKKYSNKKVAGITQLLDYVDAFKRKEQIESIWAFLVTDIDDRFATKLKRDGYKPLFSTKTPIYHRYYDNTDTSIYVVGAESLISDAEARNKVFIDIINKQKSLEFLFKKEDVSEEKSTS